MSIGSILTPSHRLQDINGKFTVMLASVKYNRSLCCCFSRDMGAYSVLGILTLHADLFGGGNTPCCCHADPQETSEATNFFYLPHLWAD